MAKYHLKHDGMPAICKASVKACPRGGEDDHFDSIVAAAQASEERNKPREVPAAVKKVPLAERMRKAVDELELPEELKDVFRYDSTGYTKEAEAYVEAKELYEANSQADRGELSKLRSAVRTAEYGLVKTLIERSSLYHDMPQSVKEQVWNKAWEDGHSSGYGNVYREYQEIVDFAKEVYDAGTRAPADRR